MPQPKLADTVILTDTSGRVPTDHFILEGIDARDQPHFTVSEAAKFFFGRSSHWIRWHEKKGSFVLDGKPVGTRRKGGGARYYTLNDIEEMAHALASKGAISGNQLRNALVLVEAEARIWSWL